MIHIVKPRETLTSLSFDYRLPLSSLIAANPTIINPNILYVGQPITIPNLRDPSEIPYRIEISITKRTLTLKSNEAVVKVYPIAVGKILTATPQGEFVIVNREPNPGGPFGAMWLSLSKIHYGIHGTNDPSSIGKSVSLGCVRMHNKDVLELARIVPNGTGVSISL
ncbi:L,D-transpeptidase family protein [Priestia filamentosa]|uniref:L,D-transpeptidase family protein n=1 Tax=Priestia filamentosa TaxID=1402861 RepID=UPI001FB2C36E|nr:L,D-transpeptidase family protein [Priestia filamentosa]MED3728616.1 L,D-transpeptidase family protein [Priestia filamentosa]UOE62505.1 L,D-transpeptidase family protein [Priestia filamentosa]